MNKRLLALVPAAVAGGVLLLSSCGSNAAPSAAPAPSTSAAPQITSSAPSPGTSANGASGGGQQTKAPGAGRQTDTPHRTPVDKPSEGKDVNCGPTDPNQKDAQDVIAEAKPAGTVGCTEVFNVLDEYKKHPIDPQGGTMREARLTSGWTCAMAPHASRQGVTIVSCGDDGGRSFRSEPAKG
ncbi:hypothetical protein [Amycolatopsis samaneae]|uniref:Secreted protein n=1 Tax=Amycolatopsis samaneae TaxID=664691 RepID=A0ABW5GBI3_9PSEU